MMEPNKMLARMQVSVEILYHYRCGVCSKWWSVADLGISIGQAVSCPHCGQKHIVESMVDGKQKNILGVGCLYPPPKVKSLPKCALKIKFFTSK